VFGAFVKGIKQETTNEGGEPLMKKRSLGIMAIMALAASLFVAGMLYAGTTAPAEFEVKAPYEHTKEAVTFTHEKHIKEHKIACGECHHDDKGKPLDLKEGDNVKSCFECHNKPGEIKGKEAKGLSKEEKLAYHANALHENCISCHRQYNKDHKDSETKAPQKCTDCHPKKAK
jgi:hypothetical protein